MTFFVATVTLNMLPSFFDDEVNFSERLTGVSSNCLPPSQYTASFHHVGVPSNVAVGHVQ